jgi:hypothetical protein
MTKNFAANKKEVIIFCINDQITPILRLKAQE